MELLSKDILDQIRAAKAKREAAGIQAPQPQPEDENVDPFRSIEGEEADKELAGKRGLFLASW